jgi:hypothetical protein
VCRAQRGSGLRRIRRGACGPRRGPRRLDAWRGASTRGPRCWRGGAFTHQSRVTPRAATVLRAQPRRTGTRERRASRCPAPPSLPPNDTPVGENRAQRWTSTQQPPDNPSPLRRKAAGGPPRKRAEKLWTCYYLHYLYRFYSPPTSILVTTTITKQEREERDA